MQYFSRHKTSSRESLVRSRWVCFTCVVILIFSRLCRICANSLLVWAFVCLAILFNLLFLCISISLHSNLIRKLEKLHLLSCSNCQAITALAVNNNKFLLLCMLVTIKAKGNIYTLCIIYIYIYMSQSKVCTPLIAAVAHNGPLFNAACLGYFLCFEIFMRRTRLRRLMRYQTLD